MTVVLVVLLICLQVDENKPGPVVEQPGNAATSRPLGDTMVDSIVIESLVEFYRKYANACFLLDSGSYREKAKNTIAEYRKQKIPNMVRVESYRPFEKIVVVKKISESSAICSADRPIVPSRRSAKPADAAPVRKTSRKTEFLLEADAIAGLGEGDVIREIQMVKHGYYTLTLPSGTKGMPRYRAVQMQRVPEKEFKRMWQESDLSIDKKFMNEIAKKKGSVDEEWIRDRILKQMADANASE